jgi:hypothetical protein
MREIDSESGAKRRPHPCWGARRIAFKLARKRAEPAPFESAVYRCLIWAAIIDPVTRQRRRETWKRWERGAPLELRPVELSPPRRNAGLGAGKCVASARNRTVVRKKATPAR